MDREPQKSMREIVDGVYRAESRRVFATLIRLLGDFDVAEEALHDAFRAALRAALKRSTACAGARASTRSTRNSSRLSLTRAPPRMATISRTTGCD